MKFGVVFLVNPVFPMVGWITDYRIEEERYSCSAWYYIFHFELCGNPYNNNNNSFARQTVYQSVK